MSFMSEYLKLRKKKLDEEEEKTDDAAEDAADKADGNEIHEYLKLRGKQLRESSKEEKKTWFTGGAFSDGYQFGDITKTATGTANDIVENVTQAVADATENLVDTAAYGVGQVGGWFSKDFQNGVKDFIAHDYSKEAGDYINKSPLTLQSWISKIIGGTDENSLLGDKSEGIVQSGAHLAGQAALQMVGVPWWLTSSVNSFGGEIESAFNEDATYGEAGLSGAISAGAEILTEKLGGAFKFQGKALGDGLTDLIGKKVSNKIVKTLLKFGVDAGLEGFEEIASEAASSFGKWITYQDEKTVDEMFLSEEAMDSYLEAFIGGAFLGGVGSGVNATKNIKKGADPVTGLTKNEQKVVDQVYEKRVAEKEKQGEKLSKKDKNKLYDETIEDMQNGNIGISEIEEILGGDSYKAYKSETDNAKKLKAEYDELAKMENGKRTYLQDKRLAELDKMDFNDTSKADGLKKTMSDEVYNLVKGDRKGKGSILMESYREEARKGEAFKADYSQYKGTKYESAAKQTIDNAIKAKANDTRKVHNIVDMAAKLSSETGVVYEFGSNETIKEDFIKLQSEKIAKLEAIENPTEAQTKALSEMKDVLQKVKNGQIKVNGNVSSKGVMLNLDSYKALNRVVGHELTHTLEKTAHYEKLQKALFDYAKTKGVKVDEKIRELESLYAGVEGDAKGELTADLVGDYLFNDYDFVKSLSKDRNLFQKIWDEVKYIAKMAKPGSKEARELAKVERMFEKAYQEMKTEAKAKTKNTANNGDAKYSLSEADNNYLDAVNKGDMETAQRMVDEAAKKWGAISNGNTRVPKPLHLYHGTGAFGFTRFHDGRIYATVSESVAAGYNRGAGLGKVRSASNGYIRNDGTVETAIKNAKNVLGATLTKLDDSAKQNIINKADNILKDVANKVAELDESTDYEKAAELFEYLTEKYGEDKSIQWTNHLDNLHYMLAGEYTAAEIIENGEWLAHDIEKYHEWKQSLSELWSEEREAIKDSTLDKVFRYLLGYEYGDALIDIEYGLGRLLDDRQKLVNPNGNLVYLDDIVDGIEMVKDTGIYDLYGNPGEKPLIIDEGKRFWDAIPFENGFRSTDYIVKWAKENGYTSVLFKTVLDPSSGGSANVYADEWVFFNSNQVKSADPVTYDDNGNVIPLSERFNAENDDIRYSLSKDIENFDNSWYNEVELPTAEQDRIQSAALTWHPNERNQLITQTIAYANKDITYRYVIDDDGIVHVYDKSSTINIHEAGGYYANTDTKELNRFAQELRAKQGNNSSNSRLVQDGRKSRADDTGYNNSLRREGRSDRTGYSKNRYDAYRKPKIINRHFNDDGSITVEFDDGTIETRNSLSEADDIAPIGRNDVFGRDFRVQDDIAPVTENAEVVNQTVNQDVNQDVDTSVETVEEKISKKLENFKTELSNNEKLRAQANADFDAEISRLQAEYDAKKKKDTKVANDLLRRIERVQRMKSNVDADYDNRITSLQEKIDKLSTPEYKRGEQRKSKQQAYTEEISEMIGDTSTWRDKKMGLSYQTNTLHRNLRDVVRDKDGNRDIAKADEIYEYLQGSYNHNEAKLKLESRDIKKPLADLNLNKHESQYAQMLGEFKYNPETKLSKDTVDGYYNKHKSQIDKGKVDKAIEYTRKTYDDLIVRVNEVLREQGMKEIEYRKGYFPHFTDEKQGFLAKLFNWKTQNNEIPTDIAGLTESFEPNRSWQSFNKQRKGDTTDYNLLRGFDTYVHGALDWIHHIEDIQKRRAFENELRYRHSEQGIKDKIDNIKKRTDIDADEAQELMDAIYAEARNPLNNFVTDLRNGTNNLAGKKSAEDRNMEYMTNRKIYSTMTNLSNRVTANMVAGSVSSALTNFIPITQSWGQVSPISSLKATKAMIKNAIRSDGMIERSDFMTNRLRTEENLNQTGWDKAGKALGSMMEIADRISTEVVWRSKYSENVNNGMSVDEAIHDADIFAENVMAGRSRGNMPTAFNAKNPVAKMFTAFQLEVANQYGYMFKDMPQDIGKKNVGKLVKGYASVFVGAYVYNALYSALTGRDAAFSPIDIIQDFLRDLGLGDDEEEELDILGATQGLAENVVQEVPFVGGLVGGGRVPISSALPYDLSTEGFNNLTNDLYGMWNEEDNEKYTKSFFKEMAKPVWYVGLPMGGGQIKKTTEGLSMFSDDIGPVSGSYTNSGNLRFPVEDTPWNRIQAGIFGQYSSKNAREYFDEGYAPLNPNQTQEYADVGMSFTDYHKYRDGLKGLKTLAEKFDYIDSLDLTVEQKNILINNIVDRDEPVDMTDYGNYGHYEEFDFAVKNPEKYSFFKDNNISYEAYAESEESREAYNWAYNNPEKYEVSKAVGDVMTYRTYSKDLNNIQADKDKNGNSISGSRKKKVVAYINNLDADYGAKIILYKTQYPADDRYNKDIVEYLNERDDISYMQMVVILTELGMKVDANGKVTWD